MKEIIISRGRDKRLRRLASENYRKNAGSGIAFGILHPDVDEAEMERIF